MGKDSASFARLGGNAGRRQDTSANGYEDEVSWEDDAQEQEEMHPSTAVAMAIARANPEDPNQLQVHVCIRSDYLGHFFSRVIISLTDASTITRPMLRRTRCSKFSSRRMRGRELKECRLVMLR